jgi:hypothetical protein
VPKAERRPKRLGQLAALLDHEPTSRQGQRQEILARIDANVGKRRQFDARNTTLPTFEQMGRASDHVASEVCESSAGRTRLRSNDVNVGRLVVGRSENDVQAERHDIGDRQHDEAIAPGAWSERGRIAFAEQTRQHSRHW